jgi:hypothetical protein
VTEGYTTVSDPNFGGVVVSRDDPADEVLELARANAVQALTFLLQVVSNDQAPTDSRVRAAESILGVAGCLSL